MLHPVPVRGTPALQIVHRLLVLGHGIERLLAADASNDERCAYDLLAVRIVDACEPSPCVPADIARALLCRRQTASPLAQRLLREDLVWRAPVSDGRCRAVRLTERGRRLALDADDRLTGVGRSLFGEEVSEQRMREVAAILHQLELAVREAIFDLDVTWKSGLRGRPARGRKTLGQLCRRDAAREAAWLERAVSAAR